MGILDFSKFELSIKLHEHPPPPQWIGKCANHFEPPTGGASFWMHLFLSSRVLTNALDNGAFKKNNKICGALQTPLLSQGLSRGNFWLNFDSWGCLLLPCEVARWTHKYHLCIRYPTQLHAYTHIHANTHAHTWTRCTASVHQSFPGETFDRNVHLCINDPGQIHTHTHW